MAEPLSVAASVLAVVAAAIASTRSLNETVKRYKDRDKTLRKLHEELEDLLNILDALGRISNLDASMLSLLKGPVDRCSRVCRDFDNSMREFIEKSRTGFRDWSKIEFMRGGIHDFMDTVMGYKSTIAVGLGTITMHTSKLSHQVFEEYNEMIKDTTYNLNLHLQRIDEKLALIARESTTALDTSIDLKDERMVTTQCLRICKDASSYLESLTDREPSLRQPPVPDPTSDTQNQFEAQLLTRKILDDHRDKFSEIIGRMRERLDTLPSEGTSRSDQQRLLLQEDIDVTRQSLEVCKRASNEVSQRKVYKVGEAIADEDSDQVLVTTLADLFDVKKASSTGRSAQFLGLVTDETLQRMSEDRYGSRFGTMASGTLDSKPSPSSPHTQTVSTSPQHPAGRDRDQTIVETGHGRPYPNEMRKRTEERGVGRRKRKEEDAQD